MHKSLAVVVCAVLGSAASAAAQEAAKPAHISLLSGDVKWVDGPPSLPKGAMMAVLTGDPTKPGPFTVRLKLPAGFKVAPHWHPADEHVTVLAGSIAFGMGEKFDPAGMKELPVGSFSMMPAEMRHFAASKSGVTIQLHGVGPFTITYVNPADDPRQAAAATK
jgi:hypothetical protein